MKIPIILTIVMLLILAACGSGQYDKLAQCLTDEGVTFYGAYWCPHCADQKERLGTSMKYITYIECSLPDKKGQTQVCKDENIKQYPTWEFQSGERAEGVQTPQKLSEKSGCAI